MKKIALIMESWMRYFTYAWPFGILQKIKESDIDANLYIFNSSGNWSDDKLYNQGEYNIFNLPDLQEFDGIVLDVNNIIDFRVREELTERVRRFGVPAIVIGNHFDGLRSVEINNVKAMQEVMAHLYEKHGCKTFWFIMGPRENYENQRRVDAIEEYLTRHSDIRHRFYYGDFGCECGSHGFDELYAHNALPDAIVCANDNIAVGVLDAAERKGFSAPGDFLLTGFDDLDKSRYYDPKISTVSYVREELGYTAMEMLEQIWNGNAVEEIRYTDIRTIFWDSCGCSSDLQIDLKKHLKDSILYGIETENFEKQLLKLKYTLTQCDSVQEMLKCIARCIPSLRCDELYLVTDTRLYRTLEDLPFEEQMNLLLAEDPFVLKGYPEDMRLAISYTKHSGGESDTEKNVGNDIFPMFESEDSGVDFLFLPLHFTNRCIGYFAIRNAVYLMEKQFLFDIINALTTALENLYSKERLKNMNQILTALYNHDSMTMLYNRLELEKLGGRYLRMHREKKETVYVAYLDLDGLKQINDRFGHDQGDFAIKAAANAMKEIFPRESLLFRLGGDEFLVICSGMSEEELRDLHSAVQEKLKRTAQERGLPYELGVSFGYAAAPPESEGALADYIHIADDEMYRCKVERKKQRLE